MANNCVFTICTKSYIGLATVLKDSIYKNSTEIFDFKIFICDDLGNDDDYSKMNIFSIKETGILNEKKWINLSFKYDVTEFCTTLKPYMFQYLLNNGYDRVIYLDPDILFFNNIKFLFDGLNDYLIEVTPHYVSFPKDLISNKLENEVAVAGIYNFGFCGIKKSKKTQDFLEWWKDKLDDKGFSNPHRNQFTDQRWMNFLSAFFCNDELNVVHHLGCNLAPWNFFERKLLLEKGNCFVQYRDGNNLIKDKLIFVHYSGFNYRKIIEDSIFLENNSLHSHFFEDFNYIFDTYREEFFSHKEIILRYLDCKYTYNYYDNGVKIEKVHRRLYNGIIEKKIEEDINPFEGEGLFFNNIVRKKIYRESKGLRYKKYKQMNNKENLSKSERIFQTIMKLMLRFFGLNKYFVLMNWFDKYQDIEEHAFLL